MVGIVHPGIYPVWDHGGHSTPWYIHHLGYAGRYTTRVYTTIYHPGYTILPATTDHAVPAVTVCGTVAGVRALGSEERKPLGGRLSASPRP